MISIQKNRRYRRTNIAIDMAPLIDMVFILLIFFIVTSTFAPETSVQIKRPEVTQVSVVSSRSMTFSVDTEEKIYLENQEISLIQVEGLVRRELRGSPDLKVLVVSDKKASIDLILKILDACRRAGVEASIAAKAGGRK